MTKLKILVANQTLDILAGSEMWTLTLAAELKKLGHEITAYSPQLGFIATKLEALGVKCVKEITGASGIKPFSPILQEAEGSFDVVICAHYEITKYIKSKLPQVPIIAVVHGIIHSNPENGEFFPEHPVTEFKVEQYLAVSEEVQDLLLQVYGIQAKLIRNFFDLERFKKEGKLPAKPKTILVNSNYWGVDDAINKIIKEVADHYDAKFIGIGANFASTFEVEDVMRDADIVFGMGRSVLEGVCMGKIGVVHGRWGTGGVITPESHDELARTNFSGRKWQSNNTLLPSAAIIEQIDAAWNQKSVNAMNEIMEKEHNVKVAAEWLIDLTNKIINKRID